MTNAPLHIRQHLSGIGLIPPSVQFLSRDAKLYDEIAGQVLRLDLAPLLPPEAEEGGLVVAHDDPGVRTTNEIPAPMKLASFQHAGFHTAPPGLYLFD
jgi:hypothetical protein